MDDEAGERAGARRLLLVPVVVRPLLVLKARVRLLTQESRLAFRDGTHAGSDEGVAWCAALSQKAHLLLLLDRHHELLEFLGHLNSFACLDFLGVADEEDAAAAVLECSWHLRGARSRGGGRRVDGLPSRWDWAKGRTRRSGASVTPGRRAHCVGCQYDPDVTPPSPNLVDPLRFQIS